LENIPDNKKEFQLAKAQLKWMHYEKANYF
jgi:hypothetical protein